MSRLKWLMHKPSPLIVVRGKVFIRRSKFSPESIEVSNGLCVSRIAGNRVANRLYALHASALNRRAKTYKSQPAYSL